MTDAKTPSIVYVIGCEHDPASFVDANEQFAKEYFQEQIEQLADCGPWTLTAYVPQRELSALQSDNAKLREELTRLKAGYDLNEVLKAHYHREAEKLREECEAFFRTAELYQKEAGELRFACEALTKDAKRFALLVEFSQDDEINALLCEAAAIIAFKCGKFSLIQDQTMTQMLNSVLVDAALAPKNPT